MLTAASIMKALEEKYPPALAANWDNSGLQVGSRSLNINKVLVALDCTRSAVERAEQEGATLIITHHPLIFSGFKNINFDNPTGYLLQRLCSNRITVYALHTNLDRAPEGLNSYLADRLGLKNVQIFGDILNKPFSKLVVYVPADHLDQVRTALGDAGAGHIGQYSHCSFAAPGEGTFLPLPGTQPYIGEIGTLQQADEFRLETILSTQQLSSCLNALRSAHPYEEIAYEVYPLQQPSAAYGYGRVGNLEAEMRMGELAQKVKECLGLNHLRIVGDPERRLSKAAVVSGSGASLIGEAAVHGAEVLITGDIKYHEAQEAQSRGIALIDAGHDGLERLAVELLAADLASLFPESLTILKHHEELLFTAV